MPEVSINNKPGFFSVSQIREASASIISRTGTAKLLLGLLLFLAMALAIGDGPVSISPFQILSILGSKLGLSIGIPFDQQQDAVLWAIRLPRVLLGGLVGAGLAISGVLLQGLFRNPLAEPNLLGVSSGAALSAVSVIVLGSLIPLLSSAYVSQYSIPVAAFLGATGSIFLVYRIGRRMGSIDTSTIILAGIGVNSIALAGIGLLSFIADDSQLRSITFWTLGSLGGANWQNIFPIAVVHVAIFVFLGKLGWKLNAMCLGDAEAKDLGVDIERVKGRVILVVALLVGSGIAITGIIGFVGLVVPHILRLLIGADHRGLLPASALAGAFLLVLTDWISRTIVSPAEIPVGVITAACGAPFFLWLIVRNRESYS